MHSAVAGCFFGDCTTKSPNLQRICGMHRIFKRQDSLIAVQRVCRNIHAPIPKHKQTRHLHLHQHGGHVSGQHISAAHSILGVHPQPGVVVEQQVVPLVARCQQDLALQAGDVVIRV